MPAILARYELHPIHLPYPRPIRWAGHMEAGVDIMLLVLETADGARGIGETPVRLLWHAATLKSLTAVLEEVFMPLLRGVDLIDVKAVSQALGQVREHPSAKSLIDTACWDLRAVMAGVPLWKRLGAPAAAVPVSWTVTRASPDAMAADAERMHHTCGVTAFKVKTGQGLATDRAALEKIHAVLGDGIALSADSNAADRPEDVPEMSRMLAEHGVSYFEDPCPFVPNRHFAELQRDCALPILVDNGCRSLGEADLFLDAGAQALSVKVMKTGITDSVAVVRSAEERNAKVAVGIGACSALGAVAALSLSASISDTARCLPCEETFFLGTETILNQPLTLQHGSVTLPDVVGHDNLVDWKKVAALRAG
jgi:L-alanine-DL-glutamate epimerase-like enolase superfamily enzyme